MFHQLDNGLDAFWYLIKLHLQIKKNVNLPLSRPLLIAETFLIIILFYFHFF